MAALARLGASMRHTLAARSTNPVAPVAVAAMNSTSFAQQLREVSNKLFVGGLKWEIEEDDLFEAFSKYGATNVKVIRDRETNRSRGFGFVSFANNEEAEEAQKDMDGQDLMGRTVRVDFATERPPRQPYNGGGDDRF